jgi:hypothetical protein
MPGGGEEAGTAASLVPIEKSSEHGPHDGRTLDVASAGEAGGDNPSASLSQGPD